MRKKRTAFGVAVLVAAVSAGSASGAARTGTYPFHDCVGPAGTPASFTAVKENPPSPYGGAAVAFRLTDGSGVFVVLAFDGESIGEGVPAAQATTTCLVDFASPHVTLPVTGFIAGSGAEEQP
jgi:hypothetical protein